MFIYDSTLRELKIIARRDATRKLSITQYTRLLIMHVTGGKREGEKRDCSETPKYITYLCVPAEI